MTLLGIFRDLVRNKGCTFICLNPPIDSRDPNCDLWLGIHSTLAENESKRISDRVTANMNRLSDEGKLITRPPFGYVHDPNSRRYNPDPDQQEVVKKIQLWHLCGVSMNEITNRLNNEGLGPVLNNNKNKKNSNAKFNPVTIGIILRGYGFLKDAKSPEYTIPERIEAWNNSIHKAKIKRVNGKEDVAQT